jgi:hypothetical protein
MSKIPQLIAFCGFAGAGKDEAARPLIAAGWLRFNLGDLIKSQLDPVIREQMGFGAFTELAGEKAKIRRTLEMWGEDNYDNLVRDYFRDIDMHLVQGRAIVNTKLMRHNEAILWKERGGKIYLINNPRVSAFGQFELDCMKELMADATLIDRVIHNDGNVVWLHMIVQDLFGLSLPTGIAGLANTEPPGSDSDGQAATLIPPNSFKSVLARFADPMEAEKFDCLPKLGPGLHNITIGGPTCGWCESRDEHTHQQAICTRCGLVGLVEQMTGKLEHNCVGEPLV